MLEQELELRCMKCFGTDLQHYREAQYINLSSALILQIQHYQCSCCSTRLERRLKLKSVIQEESWKVVSW